MSLGQDGPPTRTRLPESTGGSAAGARRNPRPGRNLVTFVGVVVLLIAAIAFANRGGDGGGGGGGGGGGSDSGSGSKGTQAQPTAPTGEKPVDGNNTGIASGFAHSDQGAQSAAANYAVALGSDGMFNADRRHAIVQAIADKSAVGKLQSGFDSNYSKTFLAQIGLNDDGSAPSGQTFVNRTVPAGTKVTKYEDDTADVSAWCTGLFGLAGDSSTKPVTSGWFTVSFKLKWDGSDWKVLDAGEKQGPTPVSGDNPVSGANEIADAVNGFGGFTYAR